MSTVHFDTGTYGAKRQSFHDASPRGLLEKVVKKNPKADEESLEEAHWDLMVKQGHTRLLVCAESAQPDADYRPATESAPRGAADRSRRCVSYGRGSICPD
jgi:hypothetical protein